MSTVTSSVINKSGRTIAPKAVPQRRRAAAAEAAPAAAHPIPRSASTRASVERQAVGHLPEPRPTTEPGISPRAASAAIATNATTTSIAPDANPDERLSSATESETRLAEESQRLSGSQFTAGPDPTQTAATTTTSTSTIVPSPVECEPQSAAVVQPTSERGRDEAAAVDINRNEVHISTPGATPESRLLAALGTSAEASRPAPMPHVSVATPTTQKRQAEAPAGPLVQKRARPSRTEPADRTANDSSRPSTARKVRASTSSGTTTTKPKRKGRGKPAEPEDPPIPVEKVKMFELCRDSKKGETSQREKELERLDKIRKQKKREEAQRARAGEAAPEAEPAADDGAAGASARPGRGSRAHAAPQLRMVNGRLVVDESSLRVDRHAHAQAAASSAALELVEEGDLTRRITSASFRKVEKKGQWDEELTDRFYQGLRMFGTDFQIISKMFLPARSRKQIKLKFSREERVDPQRVSDALMGPREPMDLAVLAQNADVQYQDPAEFRRELAREALAHEDEVRRQDEQLRDAARQQRAAHAASLATVAARGTSPDANAATAAFAVADPARPGSIAAASASAKRSSRAREPEKSARSKKKKTALGLGGGEQEEVLGSLDEIQRERGYAET
ncbi:MAG: Transcription factor TFIIIB component B [Phylliscum demangeonii]|nr:MAG: Transcription factor TFIIIB component B [Phylliscum demangeonii]